MLDAVDADVPSTLLLAVLTFLLFPPFFLFFFCVTVSCVCVATTQLRKYRIGEFGVCPLNECNGQPVLPIGLRDTLRYHEVMIYCPRCGLIFHPAQKQLNFREDNLDGAYFGTTFAHLLLMQVGFFLFCGWGLGGDAKEEKILHSLTCFAYFFLPFPFSSIPL